MILSNKNILIISPEPWTHDFLSKHHLALALQKLNNKVFFLNPPSTKNELSSDADCPAISIIDYKPLMRGLHAMPVFLADWFAGKDMARIKKIAGVQFDVVWTFDPFRFQNIRSFDAKIFIYHAADVHLTKGSEDRLANACDIVLAPSQQVLQKFKRMPGMSVGHMIGSDVFRKLQLQYDIVLPGKNKLKIVYAGNLASRFLAYRLLHDTVQKNPEYDFIFIGDDQAIQKIEIWNDIRRLPNCYLVGRKKHEDMIRLLTCADLLWYCYDTVKYQKEASNSHKLLEYLATGKVVAGTSIAYYEDSPGIIQFPDTQENLPKLIQDIARNIEEYNSHDRAAARVAFAAKHTFENAMVRIDNFLKEVLK